MASLAACDKCHSGTRANSSSGCRRPPLGLAGAQRLRPIFVERGDTLHELRLATLDVLVRHGEVVVTMATSPTSLRAWWIFFYCLNGTSLRIEQPHTLNRVFKILCCLHAFVETSESQHLKYYPRSLHQRSNANQWTLQQVQYSNEKA